MDANTEAKSNDLQWPLCKYIYIILSLFALIAGIPFLINLLFKLPAPLDCLSAEWKAEDALSYYGAILTFLGTSALSVLALIQNKTINMLNLQHTRLLEQMEKDKHAPVFLVKYVSGGMLASNLTIALVNLSENIAKDILISEFQILDGNDIMWQTPEPLKTEYIGALQKAEFKIKNGALPNRTSSIRFSVHYHDMFGEMYRCKVVGSFLGENDNMVFAVLREKKEEKGNAKETECRSKTISPENKK